MNVLLEDGLWLIDLELGLEVMDVMEARRVGSATGFGEVELVFEDLLAGIAPVGLSASILLDLLGILTNVAALVEVSRSVLLSGKSGISKAGVVLVVELVRASHVG